MRGDARRYAEIRGDARPRVAEVTRKPLERRIPDSCDPLAVAGFFTYSWRLSRRLPGLDRLCIGEKQMASNAGNKVRTRRLLRSPFRNCVGETRRLLKLRCTFNYASSARESNGRDSRHLQRPLICTNFYNSLAIIGLRSGGTWCRRGREGRGGTGRVACKKKKKKKKKKKFNSNYIFMKELLWNESGKNKTQ
jgi:hypothetical protein